MSRFIKRLFSRKKGKSTKASALTAAGESVATDVETERTAIESGPRPPPPIPVPKALLALRNGDNSAFWHDSCYELFLKFCLKGKRYDVLHFLYEMAQLKMICKKKQEWTVPKFGKCQSMMTRIHDTFIREGGPHELNIHFKYKKQFIGEGRVLADPKAAKEVAAVTQQMGLASLLAAPKGSDPYDYLDNKWVKDGELVDPAGVPWVTIETGAFGLVFGHDWIDFKRTDEFEKWVTEHPEGIEWQKAEDAKIGTKSSSFIGVSENLLEHDIDAMSDYNEYNAYNGYIGYNSHNGYNGYYSYQQIGGEYQQEIVLIFAFVILCILYVIIAISMAGCVGGCGYILGRRTRKNEMSRDRNKPCTQEV